MPRIHKLAEPIAPKPPEALISHIVWRFHDAHRRELPQLIQLARQYEAANSAAADPLRQLSSLLGQIKEDLESHMAEEEQILFPLMLSSARLRLDPPIKQILAEHEEHTALLERIEATIRDFTGLESELGSGALAVGLRKFADDLREHLELESRVLFPQFTWTR